MHAAHSLSLVIGLLAASVFAILLCMRWKTPSIIGYLLVGIAGQFLIGSSDRDQFAPLAEFGVVFLMFSIGLEFSLPKLMAERKIVFGLGLLQVVVTIGLIGAIAFFADLTITSALIIAGALTMSSTAVLSKLLTDRIELNSAHGREVIGVLLFQDLAVVPLLIVAQGSHMPSESLGLVLLFAFIKALLVLLVVVFFGERLMRKWFFMVARYQSAELFMLNVLFVVLILAWLTELAGLSLALGAFVAGMLISETEYRHQVEENIKPFRDVLLGLFFVTIGMNLNTDVILQSWYWIVVLLVVLCTVKFIIVLMLSKAFGASQANATRSALWLCTGGEFGLVLIAHSQTISWSGLLLDQIILAAVILSMLVAPLLIALSDRLVLRFVRSEWLNRSLAITSLAADSVDNQAHILICGFGRYGQYLSRFLGDENVPWSALDLDPERVREATAAGEKVHYGDARKEEILRLSGIRHAAVLVITFVDPRSAVAILDLVHRIRPDLPVIARAYNDAQVDELSDHGAVEVIHDAVEASLMMASQTMMLTGVSLNRVLRQLREARKSRYGHMRGVFFGLDDNAGNEANDLHLHTVFIHAGSWALGKSAATANLAQYQVTISTVRRRKIKAPRPSDDLIFKLDDAIVLLGTAENLSLAEARLLKG